MNAISIDKFWASMRAMYGKQKWDRDYPIEDCAPIWSAALARFHMDQVKHAIAECARQYKHRPPNLPEFREMCRMQPSPSAPILSALKKVDPTEQAEWVNTLSALFQMKANRPMTDAQRAIHLATIGMDKEKPNRVTPGSVVACSVKGCSKAGTVSKTGKRWFCRDHLYL